MVAVQSSRARPKDELSAWIAWALRPRQGGFREAGAGSRARTRSLQDPSDAPSLEPSTVERGVRARGNYSDDAGLPEIGHLGDALAAQASLCCYRG